MDRDKRLQEVMDEVDGLLGKLVNTAARMSVILKEKDAKENGPGPQRDS